jgi:hypothetical protein
LALETPVGQVVFFSVLAAGLVVEIGLAILVLVKARSSLAGRFLAMSLFLHAGALIPSFVIILHGLVEVTSTVDWFYPHKHIIHAEGIVGGPPDRSFWDSFWDVVTDWAPKLLLWVAAADVAFALTYPSPSFWTRRRRWLVAVPFLVPAAFASYYFVHNVWNVGSSNWHEPVVILGFLLAGAVTATTIYVARLRAARTRLEARRLRYMLWIVAVPMIVLTATWFSFALYYFMASDLGWFHASPNPTFRSVRFYATYAAVGGYALVPPLAMGYGLLRYRILDWDRRVRKGVQWTLRGGLIAGAFVALFFLASEIAQRWFTSQTNSQWVGAGAALLLAFAFRPMERAVDHLVRRAVPERPTGHESRDEIYRATFEELAADDKITARERRLLGALAGRLQLSDTQVRRIEGRVARERQGGDEA